MSTSHSSLKRGYRISIGVFCVAAIAFYLIQNMTELVGGKIAFVKVLWLENVLIYWYVLPTLLMLDSRVDRRSRLIAKILLINMGLRAVIELYMMYVTVNWHPHYGITHSFFSFLLLQILLRTSPHVSSWPRRLLEAMSAFFALETFFAWYMLNHVISDSPVYYVPASSEHAPVFWITGVAVTLGALGLALYDRKWLATAKTDPAH